MFAEITPFQATLGMSLVMIVFGLLICLLSNNARSEILKTVFYWVGLVVAVLGLILFLIRPLIWIGKQLSDAIGGGG